MCLFISLLKFVATNWRQFSAALLCLITALSLLPLPELPNVPGTDKTHHFVAYAALALPVCLAGKRVALFLLPLFIMWSGAIELIQPLVNRYGEWLDLVANAVGITMGAILGALLRRILPERHRHPLR